jgi:hypothetical protein
VDQRSTVQGLERLTTIMNHAREKKCRSISIMSRNFDPRGSKRALSSEDPAFFGGNGLNIGFTHPLGWTKGGRQFARVIEGSKMLAQNADLG